MQPESEGAGQQWRRRAAGPRPRAAQPQALAEVCARRCSMCSWREGRVEGGLRRQQRHPKGWVQGH